jgi:hypothetical protein
MVQPGVKVTTISLVSFLLSSLWVTLKTTHPELAEAIDAPLWGLVTLLLGLHLMAQDDR